MNTGKEHAVYVDKIPQLHRVCSLNSVVCCDVVHLSTGFVPYRLRTVCCDVVRCMCIQFSGQLKCSSCALNFEPQL